MNDRERFDDIMRQSFAEEPTLRDRIDGGIKRLLSEAAQLEDALNREGEVPPARVQEVLAELNQSWDALWSGGVSCQITGKLRPSEHADDEGVEQLVGEAPFLGLSGRDEDLRGSYYAAHGFYGIPFGFEVETSSLGEHDVSYRVLLQFGLDEDENDQLIWFTMYPDELEYIEPMQPSPEGAEAFIGEHFPALLEQIRQLPDSCGNDEQIHQALTNFTVTIDFDGVDSDMGSEEMLDVIGQVISDRLGIDSCAYTLTVAGTIYGRDMSYRPVPKEYEGVLAQSLIGGVGLWPVDGASVSGGPVTYRPYLESWYLVPERGGGRTPIDIPVDSLVSMRGERPLEGLYPFGHDIFLVPTEESDGNFMVERMSMPPAHDSVRMPQTDGGEASDGLGEMEYEDGMALFLEELRAMTYQLRERYFSGVYASETLASKAADEVDATLMAFVERWSERPEAAEIFKISGPGLIYNRAELAAKLDTESKRYDITIDGISTSYDDMLAMRQGVLSGHKVSYGEVEDGEGYGVYGALSFMETMGSPRGTIADERFGMVTLGFDTNKFCLVDLSKDVEFELVALNYLRQRKEVSKLAATIPGEVGDKVRSHLATLVDAMEHEDAHGLKDYEDIEGLHELAATVRQHDIIADTVAQSIEMALGTGRIIWVMGAAYDQNGEPAPVEEPVGVKLEAVIARHPYVDHAEPLLILVALDTDTGKLSRRLMMPLSSLEVLGY